MALLLTRQMYIFSVSPPCRRAGPPEIQKITGRKNEIYCLISFEFGTFFAPARGDPFMRSKVRVFTLFLLTCRSACIYLAFSLQFYGGLLKNGLVADAANVYI